MAGIASSLGAGIAGGATVAVVIKAVDQFSNVFNNVNKQLLGMGTAVTAAGAAGGAFIGSLATSAGNALPIMDAFNNMLGSKAPLALDKLREATKGTVSDIDLMTQANQALLLGIDPEALPAMFAGALAAAQATGRPVSEAIGDITTGIGRGSKLILDNLGIMVDVEKANRDYATSMNIVGRELTDAEKKHAFMNATMDALRENQEKIGPITDNLSIKTQRMASAWANAKQKLGEQLIPVMTYFVDHIVSPVINFFEQHPTIAKWAAVLLVAGTALALVVGPVMILIAMLPSMATGLGMVAGALTAVSIAGLPVWVVALLIVAALIALIGIGYLVIKHWDKLKESAIKLGVGIKNVYIGMGNMIISVWNKVIDFVERGINRLIKMVNPILAVIKTLTGIGPGRIDQVDLERFKGEMMDYVTYTPDVSEVSSSNGGSTQIFNIENINGLTGRDLADSLQEELNKKVAI